MNIPALAPAALLSLAFTLLYIVFGILVWRSRATEPVNRAFGLFAVTFGIGSFVSNVTPLYPDVPIVGGPWSAFSLAVGPLFLVSAMVLLRVVRLYPVIPAGIIRWRVRHHVAAWALTSAFALAGLVISVRIFSVLPALSLVLPLVLAGVGVQWIALFRYALVYARLPPLNEGTRRQIALVHAGIAMYTGSIGLVILATWPRFIGVEVFSWHALPLAVLSVGLPIVLSIAWILNTRGAGSAHARDQALLVLASATLAFISWALKFQFFAGIARGLSIAVLTYAILRHQAFGIDVKLRWGISKTTLAAVFIAAFFIASEAAQQFFGDVAGSQYVGIIAAGALVFAIAPLHRIADRLAEKAVPVTPRPMDARAEGAPQRAYRLALLAALRDDAKIGPDEELHLADLAEILGLGAGEAMRIRREIVNARVRAP